MKLQDKKQSMVDLYHRLKHMNELLCTFAEINGEAFGDLYRATKEFELVVEDVLIKHKLIQGEITH